MEAVTDFIVVDTEGKDELNEIAIINSQGQLIYEAFVKNELNAETVKFNTKPRGEILADLVNLAQSKLIICHYAHHDIEVLKNSFTQANLTWPNLHFSCTFELAKSLFKNLTSYSLEYLSQYLNLKVNNQFFNQNFAHNARYDAQFTYQLYCQIKSVLMKETLSLQSNPFGTSRVDTPFQNHIDLEEIYQEQFEYLKSILNEIKQDQNHQSKGAVVIGEAGSGKTHLMMRLAKELLPRHRLLFIRQPNNPEAILYHIYSRILESLVEIVPHSGYSQLEYLLAQSFSKIIIEILSKKVNVTQTGEMLLNTLPQDPLNIYKVLGNDTEKKRKNWQLIEKLTLEWWNRNYGFGGYAPAIVKGLIRFCSYSDPQKRYWVRRWLSGHLLEAHELESIRLDNWSEELSQEDFSLEAIAVFSKLSIVDEPLLIIFDQLEGLKYHEALLFRFGEAVKEIFTHVANSLIILNLFPDRWQHFKTFFNTAIIERLSQYEIVLNKPSEAQLQQILAIKAQVQDLTLDTLFTPDELKVILERNSIRNVLNWASHYYRHKVDNIDLPIKIKSFEEEIRAELQGLKADIAWLKQQMLAGEKLPPLPMVNQQPLEENSTPVSNPIENDEQQLIVYLNQQQALLEQAYHAHVIINDFDDIGKVRIIIEAFKTFRRLETDHLRLGKRKLPEHLLIRTPEQAFVVAFLQVSGPAFSPRIKNFNELVINYKDIRFGLFRDVREPIVTGQVSKIEIDKLNNAPNGKFIGLEKADRITLELIYKLIIDIQNKDLEMDLTLALTFLETYFSSYWLIKIINKAAHIAK
ncbi:exonuclease RNase T and DNA polymerase III [Thioploca ingrica]|uniref:Exonuclease RNase T and DNA polymerase III n=1 Tax=Thioploca ingrica TaxID=40754 RepID=A0A090AIK3_9GAMM|nr:exonuclease RNase T and DNA polymerase III [Thioploca ingrica]